MTVDTKAKKVSVGQQLAFYNADIGWGGVMMGPVVTSPLVLSVGYGDPLGSSVRFQGVPGEMIDC